MSGVSSASSAPPCGQSQRASPGCRHSGRMNLDVCRDGPLLHHDGPFLRHDAITAGLTKHHVDGATYHRLFGCVRVPARLDLTPHLVAQAAALVVPHGVISHYTAARLHGGVVPDDPHAHVTVDSAKQRRRREGLVVHVASGLATTVRDGVLITSAAQTWCDLADELGLIDLAVCGDSMIHQGSLTIDDALDAAEAKRTGEVTLARRAVDLLRAGAESPMESRVRLMMLCARLPEPAVNATIRAPSGVALYRLDLSYRELRFGIEYDGRQHADDAQQWGHDVSRREWFDAHGWRILVLRATDVYDTPWETVRRIAGILAERGYEKQLPVRAPAEFALHFAGRPWKARRAGGGFRADGAPT